MQGPGGRGEYKRYDVGGFRDKTIAVRIQIIDSWHQTECSPEREASSDVCESEIMLLLSVLREKHPMVLFSHLILAWYENLTGWKEADFRGVPLNFNM